MTSLYHLQFAFPTITIHRGIRKPLITAAQFLHFSREFLYDYTAATGYLLLLFLSGYALLSPAGGTVFPHSFAAVSPELNVQLLSICCAAGTRVSFAWFLLCFGGDTN